MSSFEVIERNGIRYAEVLRADVHTATSRFFSPPDSSLQLGLLAHEAGFYEPPHTHKPARRLIQDVQQMLIVQRGVVAVEFYAEDGTTFRDVVLRQGDAILLVHGAHAVRVMEDMQCVSVKQGPFLGAENDKVPVKTK
ncbi:MAG: hypothetical protein ABSA52_11505 [Candidatus Binatia bacterium]|jgi:hypothetical protein